MIKCVANGVLRDIFGNQFCEILERIPFVYLLRVQHLKTFIPVANQCSRTVTQNDGSHNQI